MRVQSLAQNGHPSVWWPCLILLNFGFWERVLLLCTTDSPYLGKFILHEWYAASVQFQTYFVKQPHPTLSWVLVSKHSDPFPTEKIIYPLLLLSHRFAPFIFLLGFVRGFKPSPFIGPLSSLNQEWAESCPQTAWSVPSYARSSRKKNRRQSWNEKSKYLRSTKSNY